MDFFIFGVNKIFMKNLLALLLIFSGISTSFAQNIPNSSFENWLPYTSGEFPQGWTTSDSISVQYGGGTSVYSGTDPYDGVKSIHLKSVQINVGIPVTGPGIATNGLVNLSGFTFVFSGGTPDTVRYRFFTANYKYMPTNGFDAAVVKVYLLKYNATTSARDTIATGVQEISGSHTVYEPLVLPLDYRNWIAQPDTFLIILQSSRNINDPTICVGSEFVVDSLNFSGFVGVDELKNSVSSVNVFPVPADKELNVEVVLKNTISLSYEIYDSNGRMIQSSSMNTTKEKIDISKLAAGRYIFKLGDSKRNQLYSTNFSIAR